jgi:hypothetical protein
MKVMTNTFAITKFDGTVDYSPVYNVQPVVTGYVAQNEKGQPLYSPNGISFVEITVANYLEAVLVKAIESIPTTPLPLRVKPVLTLSGIVENLKLANIKFGANGFNYAVISGQHSRKVVQNPGATVWIELASA